MKVLWFSNTPGLAYNYLQIKSFGGGWISAIQSEIEADNSCVLGLVYYTDLDDNEFHYGKTTYFPVKRINSNKYKRYLFNFISKVENDENVEKFLKIINKFNPDIIHIFGTENPFGLIVNRVKNIPIVIWIQGNLNVYSYKYFSGIDRKSVYGYKHLFYDKTITHFTGFSKKAKIEQEILKNASFIIGRTDWDRRVSRILAPSAKYFFVNDLARPQFYKNKWKFNANTVATFFTTTGHNLYKGFESILDAAIHLKKLNYKFRWIVAGLNANDTIVKLSKKLRKIKNLESFNILLLDKVSEETLINHMLVSDIFVQVSHIENNPNSLIEAMLLGMPIIATHAGGTSNLINNDVNGILIQDGDPFALSGALIELIENQEKLVQLGNNAYKISHSRHNPSKVLNQLITTYNTILKMNH